MRTPICLIMLAFAALVPSSRAAFPGTLDFNFRMVEQISLGITSRTNATSTVTNIVSVSQYVTSNAIINDQMLVKMLANSFATNLPTNATLSIYDGTSGAIAVTAGTNFVLDASPVLRVTRSIDGTNYTVYSGSAVFRRTINQNGVTTRSRGGSHATCFATVEYDDTCFPTADGTSTRFKVTGVEDIFNTSSVVGHLNKYKDISRFIGTGEGTFSNSVSQATIVLSGTFTSDTSASFTNP